MDIFIFGSRGPNGKFSPDSDVDVVVVEKTPTRSNEFEEFKLKFRPYALENSDVRAALDLFYLKNLSIPILESVYDWGDRTISFEIMQDFINFKGTWLKISENDLMKIVIDAKENCK